ncbi:MAG: sigma-70 family RNA polymerase sigma factor [Oscillospiraceae bacterium]|nr:sigma-70 family RNA polymerase sigma factor [Oscillospiraceae bacterium]
MKEQSNERAQRDELTKKNLGLVHLCANRFRGKGIEYEELFSAGCVGLVKASSAFDSSRGVCFSTYAVPVIIGEIKRLFRDGGLLKVSRSIKELSLRAGRERDRFILANGREPQLSELAEILGVPAEDVAEALNAVQSVVSLTKSSDDDDDSQNDIACPSPDEEMTDRLSLIQAMDMLPANDRRLIYLRYYKDMTQSETAKQLDMTQVQVSRREKKILCSLRRELYPNTEQDKNAL